MTAAETALRALGLFYVFAGIIGARQVLLGVFMDRVIEAVSLKATPRAEALRDQWLGAGVVAVFASGVLLVVLSELALPAFALGTGLQAFYLFHAAPRWLDPGDEPDEAGRRSTTRAFWLYGVATAFVALAFAFGLLRPVGQQAWWLLALAGLTILGFAAHVAKGFLARSWPGVSAGGRGGRSGSSDLEPDLPDHPLPERIRLQVRPPVLPFADDETGRVVPQHQAEEALGAPLVSDILDWELRYLDTIPARKRTGGFPDPAEAARHEAEGRELASRMAAALGPDRAVYRPFGTIFPQAPERLRTNPYAIKVMADYGCHPLWSMEEQDYGEIAPDALGLSAELCADLDAWARAFEDALDWDDPGAEPLWGEEGEQRHEEEGRRLAVRVARELAALGRGHIVVYAMTREVGVVPMRADEPL